MKNLILSVITAASLFTASSSMAIIHGDEVKRGDPVSKFTVAIMMQTSNGWGICSGSIIRSDMILTAGHCASGIQSAMIVFKRDVTGLSNVDREFIRPVVSVNIDPSYILGSAGIKASYRDVAIMKFSGGLPSGFKAVRLLSPKVAPQLIQREQKVVLVGFGASDFYAKEGSGVMRKIRTKIDKVYYDGTGVKVGTAGHGACHGDSGGPALIESNGEYYLFAVTSRATMPVSSCSGRAVYSRVR